MKKKKILKIIIPIILIGIITATGIGYATQTDSKISNETEAITPSTDEIISEIESAETAESVVDALAKDISVEDTSTDKDGNEIVVGKDDEGNTVEIKTASDGTVTKTVTDKETGSQTTQTTKVTTTTSTTKETTTKKTETTTKKTETTTKKSETTTKGHTHSYTSTVTTKATCTKAGIKTFKCSCGESYTESIPATGHNWKSETVHHDAVYGTRDITEEWMRIGLYTHLYLTSKGIEKNLDNQAEMRKDELYFYKFGNKEFAPQYTIKVYEVTVKASEYAKGFNAPSLQWIYRYNSNTNVGLMQTNAMTDFDNKYGRGCYDSYGDTEIRKTEIKVVGTEKYIKEAAYDETIYTCTTCGAHK